jgi:nitrate reductase delta subunit
MDAALLEAVAAALEYPGPGKAERPGTAEALTCAPPALASALRALGAYLAAAPAGEAEERYTALFDLNPVCTLHAGYHLFGEDYKRGELLAGLAAELRKADLLIGTELPDYFPALLRLTARSDPAGRETLVDYLLLPALVKMTDALKASESPWAAVVRALSSALAPLGTGEDVAAQLFAPAPDCLRRYTQAADLPEKGDRHMPNFNPPSATPGPGAD